MKQPSMYAAPSVVTEIQNALASKLNKCGLYYRLFARYKSDESIAKKLSVKNYSHQTGYLMQDFIGVRIALYFCDDIPICEEIIHSFFEVLNVSSTSHDSETFNSVVLNMVCRIPDETLSTIDPQLWTEYPFDKTFEIQIRTVFSEGWHEIEHDVRYKCKSDWTQHQDLDRNLNGILATLETCDWSIIALIKDLAYREYKNKQWSEMLKNKLRIHLINTKLSDEIIELFNNDTDLAKCFYRCDRRELLMLLSRLRVKLPLTANNMVYLINSAFIHNPDIATITPPPISNFLRE